MSKRTGGNGKLGNPQKKTKIFLGNGNNKEALTFFRHQEVILNTLEKEYEVKIVSRGNQLQIIGEKEEVDQVTQILKELINWGKSDLLLTPEEIEYALKNIQGDKIKSLRTGLSHLYSDVLLITTRGKPIKPKTLGQKRYIKAMESSDLVFAIGPAGTGKTYLAVAQACLALKEKEVQRIILTRPAVEAGEKLGFLPGDIQAKVDPYFRPLYDALFDMLDVEKFQKYLERGIIEIAPLAFMRGRTLNDAFIILDEAQNTTSEQMKMFLTRMGFSSRAVVTGDITQIDLPEGKYSGLTEVQEILSEVEGVEFVYMTDEDVVRHELVQKIIKAYEKYEDRKTSFAHKGA